MQQTYDAVSPKHIKHGLSFFPVSGGIAPTVCILHIQYRYLYDIIKNIYYDIHLFSAQEEYWPFALVWSIIEHHVLYRT